MQNFDTLQHVVTEISTKVDAFREILTWAIELELYIYSIFLDHDLVMQIIF